MYYYIKALHIIFIVTWFAGLFYFPRLLIYNAEIQTEPDANIKSAMTRQYLLMMKRLWYGITVPSAIMTLILGSLTLHFGHWAPHLFDGTGTWLLIKLGFVILLYIYFFSLGKIFKQQSKGIFKYSGNQLRFYNEVATVFLFAIVFLATVKSAGSLLYGLGGLILLILILVTAIKIYKKVREKKSGKQP
ncbi:CopD family protein [Arachidicoccus terrestris]|uniref:CopD family protein n=1 Tax=Arachidicoccus terrestris TaxID=2875539 RepID=UPI001CC7EC60|nr:CopD family protein [Arachidicoccus terrestris]UAY56555.1 CopD family protein [Arachidicoccus terrestris]